MGTYVPWKVVKITPKIPEYSRGVYLHYFHYLDNLLPRSPNGMPSPVRGAGNQ
jgi:hypothetical protein